MIYLLFGLSGISGLIFEIIWVRQFGNLFGNPIHSAALVTAIFMLGLGLGAYLAGIYADRKGESHPAIFIRYHAYLEIAIGAAGFLYAVLMPHLEVLSPAISAYVVVENGWRELSLSSHLSRYLIATVFLLPVTLLMGGTLTLLIRFLVADDLRKAGWRTGLLYAANTAGAALGCFLVDYSLIPNIGLFGSQAMATVRHRRRGNLVRRLFSGRKTPPAGGPSRCLPVDVERLV